jgi:hypothetical protein
MEKYIARKGDIEATNVAVQNLVVKFNTSPKAVKAVTRMSLAGQKSTKICIRLQDLGKEMNETRNQALK